jgi:hypothetical protein
MNGGGHDIIKVLVSQSPGVRQTTKISDMTVCALAKI